MCFDRARRPLGAERGTWEMKPGGSALSNRRPRVGLQTRRPDVRLSQSPQESRTTLICQDCGKSRAQPAVLFACAVSQQGSLALRAEPLAGLTGGHVRGCWGRNRSVVLAIAPTGLKFDGCLKGAFVEPRAFWTGCRKGLLSFLFLFQVSFW